MHVSRMSDIGTPPQFERCLKDAGGQYVQLGYFCGGRGRKRDSGDKEGLALQGVAVLAHQAHALDKCPLPPYAFVRIRRIVSGAHSQ
jgi:hypothetical protein